jgi:hypothetical protein
MIGSDSLANLYSGLVIGIYILLFLLLVSANIALWKYIISGSKRSKSMEGNEERRK